MSTIVNGMPNRFGEGQAASELFDRFAPYYDGDYRDYEDDIDLILGMAQVCGDPILELGCGTGRVMRPLVKAGYSVTGIDISPRMLDVAREKLNGIAADDQFSLVQGDLATFDLPSKEYQLAICTSNTLMHLPSADQQMGVLENTHGHLVSDGLLLVDLFNPDVARLVAANGLMELADEWEDSERGVHVVKWSVRTVDFAYQVQDTLFIYEETGGDGLVRRAHCPFPLRFLWRNEAELMLRLSGFELDAVWGGFDGEPYEADSERLVLLARKP